MPRSSKRGIKEGNRKKKIIVFVVLIVLIIFISGGVLAYKIISENNKKSQINNNEEIKNDPIVVELENKEEKKVNIYQGNDRPIAFMIDNHKSAQPQAGLNDAYIVYEIIVEGGESRLMALFKGKNLEKIGPIRSSRHYFLDYAMENDAIYVHYGWSPQAQSDISTYKINNINGISESSKTFWRVKDKSAPHNAVTSTDEILKVAQKKNYRTTSDEKSVLNYVTEEVNLDSGEVANKITIPYSTSNKVSYEYDSNTKTYVRYSKGKKQVDWVTGEDIKTKNIIITFAKNYALNDGENKDRQGLNNIGNLDGYYITNGKAIKITCNKSSRTAKTIYKDLNGNEIEVNDGNTFIQICPINADVEIEE